MSQQDLEKMGFMPHQVAHDLGFAAGQAAERERCAKIARTFSNIDPHGPRIALEIAAQIEKGE